MNAPLRPMNLGDILDRTFQIYRSRFLVFFGIAAVPALLMRGIYIADKIWLHSYSLIHPAGRPGTLIWNFVVGLGFYHVSSLFALLIEPAHIQVASSTVLDQKCSFASALRFAVARWRGYLWIAFLKLSGNLLGPEIVLVGLALGIGFLEDAAGLMDGKLN
ncbi:MAG: hypothetical protein WBQ94_06730, partial [Terracidiphilus sp.]